MEGARGEEVSYPCQAHVTNQANSARRAESTSPVSKVGNLPDRVPFLAVRAEERDGVVASFLLVAGFWQDVVCLAVVPCPIRKIIEPLQSAPTMSSLFILYGINNAHSAALFSKSRL